MNTNELLGFESLMDYWYRSFCDPVAGEFFSGYPGYFRYVISWFGFSGLAWYASRLSTSVVAAWVLTVRT